MTSQPLISDNDERAYMEEIKHLENWCQEINLLLNIRPILVPPYQLPGKEGSSASLPPQTPKGLQTTSKVLRNFYTCTIERILTGNITVWFGNSTKQDRQALQRVVCSAERITHMELPDLQTIYYKRCQTKARRIVKDPTHPKNRLFSLLRKAKCVPSVPASQILDPKLVTSFPNMPAPQCLGRPCSWEHESTSPVFSTLIHECQVGSVKDLMDTLETPWSGPDLRGMRGDKEEKEQKMVEECKKREDRERRRRRGGTGRAGGPRGSVGKDQDMCAVTHS
ncbi:hypothetical protein P4O66_003410 [Electrophorus voltai]|uniref:Uncharacterized protein n=1 Tax=Electrophorus voltai TaxID=2609070 RepID=A0AAD8YR54_9TELE|nr:hypothetical protein P4O66_003410 [Electrophorus voltai]